MLALPWAAVGEGLSWGSASDLTRLDARGADVQPLPRAADHGVHGLDVRIPAAAGAAVRVRDPVAETRPLTAYVADGSHGSLHKVVGMIGPRRHQPTRAVVEEYPTPAPDAN